jgi:IMP dehydrogenase/GMP reductase
MLGYLTFYSWLQSRKESFRDRYLEEATKDGLQKEQAAQQAAQKAEAATTMLQNKLKIVSDNLDTANVAVNEQTQRISEISSQLVSGNLSDLEIVGLKSNLEYRQYMHKGALQIQAQYIKELQDLTTSNDPDIFKSDFSEFFNN